MREHGAHSAAGRRRTRSSAQELSQSRVSSRSALFSLSLSQSPPLPCLPPPSLSLPPLSLPRHCTAIKVQSPQCGQSWSAGKESPAAWLHCVAKQLITITHCERFKYQTNGSCQPSNGHPSIGWLTHAMQARDAVVFGTRRRVHTDSDACSRVAELR